LNNNCIFYGLAFSGGELTIGTNANITGALVAGFIDSIGSNARFTFSSSVIDYDSIVGLSDIYGSSTITVTGWQEVY
ncbi:MAG: hypothetical protein QME05_04170, partial [Candidatus Margulisbacteria bacterium]|nr:hypothetical protein [Candidatus Margulisiibacteriota bacterium]